MRKRLTIIMAIALVAFGVLVLTAACSEKVYTVTFVDEDGTVIEEVQTHLDSTGSCMVDCPSIEKEGFILKEWALEPSDTDAISDITGSICNITCNLTAKPVWAKGCIVTFTDGKGNELESITVAEGDECPTISDPTREGYRFAGWDNAPQTITKDVTINAKWNEIKYWNVKFTDGQGNELKTQKVEDGQDAQAPDEPTRDGYLFDGWDGKFTDVKSNLTINAKWDIKPTVAMENALSMAESYLSTMAFSHDGLIEQLEFEQFTHEEAVYAADHCGADWNEQAEKAARSYMDTMSFSRGGLIDQLVFEGFTYEQASHGADSVGL